MKTRICGLYQVAFWSLLKAWVWFTKRVLTGQLILWTSNRIKSTEKFSCVLYKPQILGAQIKNWKPKKQQACCCSALKALNICGHFSLQQCSFYFPKCLHFDKVGCLLLKYYSTLQIKLFFIYLIRRASSKVSLVDCVWHKMPYILRHSFLLTQNSEDLSKIIS